MAVAPVGGWLACGRPRRLGAVAPGIRDRHMGRRLRRSAYACQDLAFRSACTASDRFRCASECRGPLVISRVMHVVAVTCLFALSWVTPLPRFYQIGVGNRRRAARLRTIARSRGRFVGSQTRVRHDGYVGIRICSCWRRPSMAAEVRPSFAVAITGASGAIYAARTLAALLSRAVQRGTRRLRLRRRLLRDELGEDASVERLMPYLSSKYGAGVGAGSMVLQQQSRPRRDDRERQSQLPRNGDCAVLDEDPGGRGARLVAQSRRTRRRRHAQGAAAFSSSSARDADEPAAAAPNMVLVREAGAMILPGRCRLLQQPKDDRRSCRHSSPEGSERAGFEHGPLPPWTGRDRWGQGPKSLALGPWSFVRPLSWRPWPWSFRPS